MLLVDPCRKCSSDANHPELVQTCLHKTAARSGVPRPPTLMTDGVVISVTPPHSGVPTPTHSGVPTTLRFDNSLEGLTVVWKALCL